jgi:hypothetical protein
MAFSAGVSTVLFSALGPIGASAVVVRLRHFFTVFGFCGFRSLTECIDTTTPAGRMMMQMVGSFAEFERAMIRERTSAGLAVARAAGRIGGRRAKLTVAQRADVDVDGAFVAGVHQAGGGSPGKNAFWLENATGVLIGVGANCRVALGIYTLFRAPRADRSQQ